MMTILFDLTRSVENDAESIQAEEPTRYAEIANNEVSLQSMKGEKRGD
jgi:hypothetical protein